MVNNQPLVLAKPVPPGWKHRLYGGQDARRYGAGTWGPPLRVGTKSEIMLIRFESAGAA